MNLAIPSILANITVPIVGMVDMAVAGHLDTAAATMIGGISIGTMLFDLLYWNFGFLRVGTGGLTAQAYGRKDRHECARILTRALGVSLACAIALIVIQWVFIKAAFMVVDCTPEVRELASRYFFVRIWAAPATLSLMAFKGWFIGMQDSVSPMVTDFVVNGMNILMSLILALKTPMGFDGIAAGTVIAQYSGLLTAVLLLAARYAVRVFSGFRLSDLGTIFRSSQTRRFFVMNSDLFIRSLCFIAIYIGFTTISARYGDLLLATSSILMKLMMLFSYFTDGFAYAGEALTGRFIGMNDGKMVRATMKWTFVWSMAIAVIFMGVYHFAGLPMLKLMTSDPEVVNMAGTYMAWLLLMPVVGCAAFTWDGIYIGATASKAIRNAMLWAVAAFVVVWGAGMAVLNVTDISSSANYGILAVHVLMAAYFAHLLARTIYLSVRYRTVFSFIS